MREYEDMTLEEQGEWHARQYKETLRERERALATAGPPDPELTRSAWSIGVGVVFSSLFKIGLVVGAVWALVSGVRWLWEHPMF
jgi:hypothetical protein